MASITINGNVFAQPDMPADPAHPESYQTRLCAFPEIVHHFRKPSGQHLSGSARFILIALLACNDGFGWRGSAKLLADTLVMNYSTVRHALAELCADGVDLVRILKISGEVMIMPNIELLERLEEQLQQSKKPGNRTCR